MEEAARVMDWEAPNALLSNSQGLAAAKAALMEASKFVASSSEKPAYARTQILTSPPHQTPSPQAAAVGSSESMLEPTDVPDWTAPEVLLMRGQCLASARLALGHVANGLNPDEPSRPVRASAESNQALCTTVLPDDHGAATIGMLQTAKEALTCIADELDREDLDGLEGAVPGSMGVDEARFLGEQGNSGGSMGEQHSPLRGIPRYEGTPAPGSHPRPNPEPNGKAPKRLR